MRTFCALPIDDKPDGTDANFFNWPEVQQGQTTPLTTGRSFPKKDLK